jgi:NAD(P)H-hydrate epimerase
MEPIVTPEEMAAIDAAAPEPTDVLVARAGAAVSAAALTLLGGGYGRRVAVICGKGNNGADGRVGAGRLARRGVRVDLIEADDLPDRIGPVDLVIDAAYGTGFHGTFHAPATDAPVLAVDIPSGIDGLTGLAGGSPLPAIQTVTFAAWKPGLLFGDGPVAAGRVRVADIGLAATSDAGLVTDEDVAHWWPPTARDTHKWKRACWVVAGSPGMTGAAILSSRSAGRSGAGYVRLSMPGVSADARVPAEVVVTGLPLVGWDRVVLDGLDRFASVVVGPGLGREPATRDALVALARHCPVPMVIDGDGLWCLASDDRPFESGRSVVLSPHDGEFTQLSGHLPGADRIAAARGLAARRRAVVLLKGPSTVVADPAGRVGVITSGDARLATAGSGDVLSGMIGALLAAGLDPFEAAATAAHLHGRAAGRFVATSGLVAGDLPDLIPGAIDQCLGRTS